MNKILGLIGIAKKGGMLSIGDEPTRVAVRAGYARAIFTASDAADNTLRRADNFASQSGITHIRLEANKETLGAALGTDSCAIFAVRNSGIAAAIIKKINKNTE